MAARSSLSLTVLFLLVLVASAVSSATAGGGEYIGASRMVIIRGPAGTSRVAGAGAWSNKWRQHYQRLEDEVAPEVVGGMLGAGDGGIGYGALNPNNPVCEKKNQCAAKGPGGSYTRPCTYKEHCPH